MKIKVLFMTLTLILVVLISGCKKNDYQATVGICPIVVLTDPATIRPNGAVGVPLNQVVTATFNEKMNPATITGSSFTLIALTTIAGVTTTTPVVGVVTYPTTGSGLTAFFKPTNPLTPNTSYTARVTTAARDLTGNPLQTDYVWSFATDLPPTVTTDPANNATGVPLNKVIVATFSVPMDSLTLKTPATNFTIMQGTTLVPGKFSYSSDGKTASFTPTSNLAPFIVYNGTISKGVKNRLGTSMANDYLWSFTTIPQLTLSSLPALGGTTSGDGTFIVGSSVTVIATANAGFTFVSWQDGVTVESTSATYQLTMPARNKTLVANYTAIPYIVSVSSNPLLGGTTTGGGTYNSGASVTVTATANPGFAFTNWTEGGNPLSSTSSYQFVIAGNRTLVANYTAIPYTVTVSSLPVLGGVTAGGGVFNSGASVIVTALPNPGFTFTNWTEGINPVSTSANYQFTIAGNRTLVANYNAIPYTVSVSSNPLLGGTTTGGGTFNSGSLVTVNAVPNVGYTFTNWKEGLVVASTNANYQFTITGNRILVANYTPITYTVAVSSNPLIGGTTSGGGTFNSGASVTVHAVANATYTFTNWTEGLIVKSTNANYLFTITGNRTLVANYAKDFTLVVTVVGNGTVVQNPNQLTYPGGTSVQLTAVPSSGSTFTSWSGDTISLSNPLTIIMKRDRAITATFTAIPSAPSFNSRFGVFGGTAGMTNQGTSTLIVGGDIGTIATGTSAITGFHDSHGDIYTETGDNIGGVSGQILSCTVSTTGPTSTGVNAANCSAATVGRLAILDEYNALAAMPVSGVSLPENLSGLTVAAGVYKAPSGSFMIQDGLSGPTGNLTLTGTATDVFVFQMASTLTVGGPGAAFPRSVILTGGVLPKNVYWQVGSAATINEGGGGTMVGTIIAQQGVSISTAGNAAIVTLNGRALSLIASVTLVNTIINVPAP